MSRWNAGMLRLLLLATLFAQPAAGAATTYLFSYFTGNGEDGLHFRDEP